MKHLNGLNLTLSQAQPLSRQHDRQAILDDRLDDLHALDSCMLIVMNPRAFMVWLRGCM
ncbi:hypothetical protein PQR65_39270 [Paraburkholderia nemoris]|uniref:hypothetical protein n=1 Tax=Paraburkholderia nemoris TaxID=2793076 RepID=UPI0038BA0015